MGVSSEDGASFEEIYSANAQMIYRTALHYSGSEHAAEEIVQEVFFKLYVNRKNIHEKAIPSWLYTTARRMAMNRRRDRRREIPDEEIGEDSREEDFYPESAEEEIFRRIRDREYQELTKEILDDLYRKSERWYDAVTLTYLLGKPQKEVAETMGISLEALQSALYRIRKWIRRKYEEKYNHVKSL